MKKFILPILPLLCAAFFSQAQEYTWAQHIAPIVYKKCASCHRDGGIAPFKLTNFQDAKAAAAAIQLAVQTNHMPPWPPDPSYNRLAHERILSEGEKTAILEWVSMGTLPGDLSEVPPLPEFPENGDLPGTPDLVLQIPNYTITANTTDEYRCFVIPSELLKDRFITAWEIVPGNRTAVHHVLVYQDTTGQCAAEDAASQEPGFECFGSACANAELFGTWAPGGNALTYPPNMGVRLHKGADLVIEVHYPQGNAGEQDSTELHLFFAPGNAGIREVLFATVADPWWSNQNTPFLIPANTIKTFNTQFNFNYFTDFTLLRVMPHMHLLGKSMEAWLSNANGSETVPLIKIPQWDFHWQGMYGFPKLLRIKDGWSLRSKFTYDNTVNNPHNPNNPPQPVHYGEQTTDEMLFLFVEYLIYQPGDENIIFDSSALISPAMEVPGAVQTSPTLLPCQPNPMQDLMRIPFYLPDTEEISLEVFDLRGKLVATPLAKTALPSGSHHVEFRGNLSPGMYFVQMTCGSGARKTSKFVAL